MIYETCEWLFESCYFSRYFCNELFYYYFFDDGRSESQRNGKNLVWKSVRKGLKDWMGTVLYTRATEILAQHPSTCFYLHFHLSSVFSNWQKLMKITADWPSSINYLFFGFRKRKGCTCKSKALSTVMAAACMAAIRALACPTMWVVIHLLIFLFPHPNHCHSLFVFFEKLYSKKEKYS